MSQVPIRTIASLIAGALFILPGCDGAVTSNGSDAAPDASPEDGGRADGGPLSDGGDQMDAGVDALDAGPGSDAGPGNDAGPGSDAGPIGCGGMICHAMASCNTEGGTPECVCGPGFEGNGSTCTDVDECSDTPCGTGTCVNEEGAYACTCPTGYVDDGSTCTDVDECAATPGLCGAGTCANAAGDYACTCPAGYVDDSMTCADVDECAATPGLCGMGTCVNGDGAYTCACATGYVSDGSTCVDVNECMLTPDVCGVGSCVNGAGVYSCTCPSGYSDDGSTCADIDECAATPGLCGAGTCINGDGTYSCTCPAGYSNDGTTCVDIDECILTPDACGVGSCVNGDGAYSCTCPAGYSDDGTTCADIDECAATPGLCGVGSCVNSAGDYSCTCPAGYSDDGTTCADVDECATPDYCGDRGVCANSTGAFTCTCLHGSRLGAGGICENKTLLIYSPFDRTYLEAAAALGYRVIEAMDDADWAARFDAGGFDAVIYSTPSTWSQVLTEARLPNYVASGGRLIFGAWNLDNSATLENAFGVSTVSYNSPRTLYTDGSVVDLWDQQEALPASLPPEGTSGWGDNGDELTLTGAGYLAARFDSVSGPGAIAVTHEGRVIVNGFLSDDLDGGDSDSDSVDDIQELARNQINLLLNPVVLLHTGSGNESTTEIASMITQMSYTVRSTTTSTLFQSLFDTQEWTLVIIDIPSSGYDSEVDNRVQSRIAAGGALIYSFYALNSRSATQTALGVSTVSYSSAPTLTLPTATPSVNFFDFVEQVNTPLVGSDNWVTNGDRLTPTGAGELAISFDTADGAGATIITNGGRSIVNGYMTDDFRIQDDDVDGQRDVLEIMENQIHYLFRAP